MNWFLLNMPLAAAFFAAWAGIPLWLTVTHPASQPSFGAADAYLDATAAACQRPADGSSSPQAPVADRHVAGRAVRKIAEGES